MNKLIYASVVICRVCETDKNLIQLILPGSKNIVKKLRACADITFDVNDELPKHLCEECRDNLEFAYNFKIQCEYTDRKLRDALTAVKSFKEEVNEIFIDFDQTNQDKCEEASQTSQIDIKDNLLSIDQNEKNVSAPIIVEFDGVSFEDYSNVEHLIEDFETPSNEDDAKEDEYLQTTLEEEGDTNLQADNVNLTVVTNSNSDASSETEINDNEKNFKNEQNNKTEKNNETELFVSDEEVGYDDEEYIGEDLQYDEAYNEDDVSNIDQTDVSEEEKVSSSTPFLHNKKTRIATKRFACDTCAEEFTKFSEFNRHKKSHGKNRYQCPICDRWFSKRYYVKNHQIVHQNEKQFNCNMCEKKYTNQGNLDRHIRVFHKQEKGHVCDKCGKGFSQSNILKQHYSVHINERNFQCDICHKCYKTQDYLNLHKHRHLPPEQRSIKPYLTKTYKPTKKICICTYCGKKSNSVALHQSHMRTHTGEKPYQCPSCKKKFSFQQSLKSHLLLHTGEKPFKCETCGLTFRQIGHLKGHQLVHTGEKRHKCLVCMKTFALRGNLTVHMRLHTGETPYHCDLCSKKFYDSNGLKRHRQTHEKELEYGLETQKYLAPDGVGSDDNESENSQRFTFALIKLKDT